MTTASQMPAPTGEGMRALRSSRNAGATPTKAYTIIDKINTLRRPKRSATQPAGADISRTQIDGIVTTPPITKYSWLGTFLKCANSMCTTGASTETPMTAIVIGSNSMMPCGTPACLLGPALAAFGGLLPGRGVVRLLVVERFNWRTRVTHTSDLA